MAVVERLAAPALEGRLTGTAGGRQARDFLADAFDRAGLAPTGTDGFLQPFRVSSDQTASFPLDRTWPSAFQGANVVGRQEGLAPGLRPILISAHFDHLGTIDGRVYPGADDNASGVAVLLALVRWFQSTPPRHPLLFAAFDAEEIGLLGARHFAEVRRVTPRTVAVNVNLDMLSRSDQRRLYIAGTAHTPALRPILEPVARRSAVDVRFGHDSPSGPGDDWTEDSDHGVFHARGIPFVYFGVEDHADYHQPTDTPDRIDPGFLGDVADTIVDAVQALDQQLD